MAFERIAEFIRSRLSYCNSNAGHTGIAMSRPLGVNLSGTIIVHRHMR